MASLMRKTGIGHNRGNLFAFDVDGVDELVKAFDELPKSVAKGVLTGTLKEAAKPLLAAAQDKVPVKTGRLRKSLKISTKVTKGQGNVMGKGARGKEARVYVGASHPQGAHAILVEFGTGPRYLKNGKYVGQAPAQPFLRPAFDETKDQMLQIVRETIWKKLAGAARALRKRAERGTLSRYVRRELGGE